MDIEKTEEIVNINNKKKGFKLTTPIAVLIGFILIALALFFGLRNGSEEKKPEGITKEILKVDSKENILGNKDAEIAVITYSDSDCPFCERFHTTMEEVVEKSDGNVAWVYRHLPIESIHPNAFNESIALECVADLAGQDAFWKYLKGIINLTMDPNNPETPNILLSKAQDLGINENDFKSCFAKEDIQNRIADQMSEAAQAGAQGTPFSIVVNQKNKKYTTIPGAASFDQTMERVNSLR